MLSPGTELISLIVFITNPGPSLYNVDYPPNSYTDL